MITKSVKKAIIFILIAGIPAVTHAQRSAKEIMENSRDVMKVGAFEAVANLVITDSKGRVRERSNITASKSYDDGTEKRLIRFLSPADIEGTTMLIYDYDEGQDDMWIYLPALKRARRIVSSEKSKSFMGSEFTNADMSSPPVVDFNHEIIDETDDQYIIESIPVSPSKESEYGYARKVSTVGRDNFLVIKMDYYNSFNVLFKTILIEDAKVVDGSGYIITHMTAENFIKGRTSEIILKDVNTGTEISDELFNVSSLGR